MRGFYEEYTTMQLLEEIRSRGYIFRHKDDVRANLVWHRLEPLPVPFEEEAIEKIRGQITAGHIDFSSKPFEGRILHTGRIRII